ncbi:hypothetical protein C1645_745374 [Glomus cerebriforme]|uniref:Uncharacterized protein n=1 Tax=Glomus cerebriforme TaxID=658196 RepID=A0A397S8B8_9GLOM|nr:hypothetical protein C1645_745374 [Glomus cerebriforme]
MRNKDSLDLKDFIYGENKERREAHPERIEYNIRNCDNLIEDTFDIDKQKMFIVRNDRTKQEHMFPSYEEFWKINNKLPGHLQCFSEVVHPTSPQRPRIHACYFLPGKLYGTEVVKIIKSILDTMLTVFKNDYGDKRNASKCLNDLVVLDKIGKDKYYWIYTFDIQSITSFAFGNEQELRDFTNKVISRVQHGYNYIIERPEQYVRILGSYSPSLPFTKKISNFGQFVGTATNVHRDDLFVKMYVKDNDEPLSVPPVNETVDIVTQDLKEQSKGSKIVISQDNPSLVSHNIDNEKGQQESSSKSVENSDQHVTSSQIPLVENSLTCKNSSQIKCRISINFVRQELLRLKDDNPFGISFRHCNEEMNNASYQFVSRIQTSDIQQLKTINNINVIRMLITFVSSSSSFPTDQMFSLVLKRLHYFFYPKGQYRKSLISLVIKNIKTSWIKVLVENWRRLKLKRVMSFLYHLLVVLYARTLYRIINTYHISLAKNMRYTQIPICRVISSSYARNPHDLSSIQERLVTKSEYQSKGISLENNDIPRIRSDHYDSRSRNTKNEFIDKFIQEAQLNAKNNYEVLEWIPYDQLKNINYHDKGGFSKIYKAIWLDGPIDSWNFNKQQWNR